MIPKFIRPGAELYHPELGKGTVVEVGAHHVTFRVGNRDYILEGIAITNLREPTAESENGKTQSETEDKEPPKTSARARPPGRPKKR